MKFVGSPARQSQRIDSVDRKRSRKSLIGKLSALDVGTPSHAPKLITTKTVKNNQVRCR